MRRTDIINEIYFISMKLEELEKKKKQLSSHFSDSSFNELESGKTQHLYEIISQLDSLHDKRNKLIDLLIQKSEEVSFIKTLLKKSELSDSKCTTDRNYCLIDLLKSSGYITERQVEGLSSEDTSYLSYLLDTDKVEKIEIDGVYNYVYIDEVNLER